MTGRKLGVNAQVMVVCGAHANEAAGLVLKPFYRHMIQKILQRAGEGRPENRGGDEVHIRGNHPLDHLLRVVVVTGERAPVREGDAVVAEVQGVYHG